MVSRHFKVAERRRKNMMLLYTVFLGVLSAAFCLMPIGSSMKDETMMYLYIAGVEFWLGLVGTIVMALKINKRRKISYRFNEQYSKHKQFGLVHFFQNTEATIADVIMFISIVGLIIAKIWISEIIVFFVFLAVFIFSFGMHCMLNGINYKYIKYKVRRNGQDE